ncbi:phosphatase [Artomyces pyxidatus]|uniref:Phosphatase n=1 Tax=Artomyces pyxidatus TaxID=48021 RepID=A0ACB8TCI2_9AGAM|nr:phosphatase [Artomyces pyxidatus]
MPTTTVHFDAILFDMDGTLIDSTAGVVGAWELFAQTYPGLDVHDILSSSHGVRTVDNLRKHCGIDDPEELEREAERFEQAIVTTSKEGGRQGIVLLPGARDILSELAPYSRLPNPRWTVCTSATRVYATAALGTTGVEPPETMVYAEDVAKGKPFPDPYLLGAKRVGATPENCLVVEDAPAGVRSGVAAGCKTLALVTTHSREQLEACNPDYIVPNLASVTMKADDTGVLVTITTP